MHFYPKGLPETPTTCVSLTLFVYRTLKVLVLLKSDFNTKSLITFGHNMSANISYKFSQEHGRDGKGKD